uniref:FAD-binding PCMH-type domain-containing protein n=1 Tax=Panagrolaimus sp. PS1159 TaxID=55785 RepID=A0AC35F520_9BILA
MWLSRLRLQSSISQKCASLVPKFESILGNESVKSSKSFREQYSHDECHHEPHMPDLVVTPKSVEEVSAIVKLCNENRVPIIPFGTGTGIEGGVVPVYGGVSIDLKGMDQVVEVNEEDFDCVVQPGVTRTKLNDVLRESGLFFSVDPGADASVCGMIATGASGTTSVRYGTIKNNTKNLEVVLPDGQILYTRGKGRRPWKSSAGYNLTELFVGQEGTLGIITSACVHLHPRPQAFSAAVCGFKSIKSAIDAVVSIRQMAIPVARIEFLDAEQIKVCNIYNEGKSEYLHERHEECPTLFLEFHGGSESEVEQQAITAEEICTANNGRKFKWSVDSQEIHRLWSARHHAYYATVGSKKGSKGFSTDVCVPISRLVDVIVDTKKDLDEHNIFGTIVGHVGEGNFHVLFAVDESNPDEMKQIWEFSDRLVKRALEAHGTCTGEHGIGLGKRKYLEEEFGPVGFEVLKTLKRTFDPNNIMNPGKVIDM